MAGESGLGRFLDKAQVLINPAAAAARQRGEPKKEATARPIISWGARSERGGRSKQEDVCVVKKFTVRGVEYELAAIFDGHGGASVATAAGDELPRTIEGYLASGSSPVQALDGGIYDFGGRVEKETVGSTALVALVSGRKLHLAYLGDSKAVLLRNDHAYEISREHNPNQPDERERIDMAGGFVRKVGRTIRVGAKGLAVSRAFGDAGVEGVSYFPDIYECDLFPGDCLLLMCDGVWKKFSLDDMIALEKRQASTPALAESLIKFAKNRKSGDNLTAIAGRVG